MNRNLNETREQDVTLEKECAKLREHQMLKSQSRSQLGVFKEHHQPRVNTYLDICTYYSTLFLGTPVLVSSTSASYLLDCSFIDSMSADLNL